MSHLTSLNCNYKNEQCKPLSTGDIIKQLENLPEWTYDSEQGHLIKIFKFKNFYHTMNFVNAIAWVANREAHHPDMQVSYGHCEVRFTTHDEGNQVTLNDCICAAKIEALVRTGDFGPQCIIDQG